MLKPRFLKALVLLTSVLVSACGTDSAGLVSTASTARPISSSEAPDLAALPALAVDVFACSDDIASNSRGPVLLIHGTTVSTQTSWTRTWIPQLKVLGRSYCTLELVDKGMSDIQASAERAALAIELAHQRSGGKSVQILGHSQGGLVPRISLKYFPQLRAKVEDLITLAGSHHGTQDAVVLCSVPIGCAASFWQQRSDAKLLAALNKDGIETWPEVATTSLYSRYDQVVTPNFDSPLGEASSKLKGGSNIANILLQDVCPLNTAEHLGVIFDGLVYALVLDALNSPGPARAQRLPADVCNQALMPGVSPQTVPIIAAELGQDIVTSIAAAPRLTEEPALRPYIATNP